MSISIICEYCESRTRPGCEGQFPCACSCHVYRKEIARLQKEAAEAYELRADDHQTIVLQALYLSRSKDQIHKLEVDLAESIGMWKGSLEAQHELEAELCDLKQRLERCPYPCDSCKEFERSTLL